MWRGSSHFAFPVLFESGEARQRVSDALTDRGIQTIRNPALHAFTEFAPLAAPGSLPAAEAAVDRHFALPLSSHQDDASVERVVGAVRDALRQG